MAPYRIISFLLGLALMALPKLPSVLLVFSLPVKPWAPRILHMPDTASFHSCLPLSFSSDSQNVRLLSRYKSLQIAFSPQNLWTITCHFFCFAPIVPCPWPTATSPWAEAPPACRLYKAHKTHRTIGVDSAKVTPGGTHNSLSLQ